jgi:hypothetical protein
MGNTIHFIAERKDLEGVVSLRRFKLSRSDAKQVIQIHWCLTNCFDMDEDENESNWKLFYMDKDHNMYRLEGDQDAKTMLMVHAGSKKDPIRLKIEGK